VGGSEGADLVIRVPGALSQQDGYYRLDYRPPAGSPAANTTFKPTDISETIDFSKGLPGTKYDFYLYYSNSSISDWLTWTASITTAPDPPTSLTIDVKSGTQALVSWRPPGLGRHSGFKLKIIPLSEPDKSVTNLVVRETNSTLKDLSPGATYEIQMYSMFENKESQAYISTNFTSKPNTPGRFIVWFRNETTLLVLWQPPYPAGFYTDYKVSIKPEDALVSETYVPKEGEPPGPAQAAFNGLVPGRAYNISVETVSEGQISDPTTAQYRTVPLRPHNVTFDPLSVGPGSFTVRWSGPDGISEFEKYQVAIGIRRKTPQLVERGQELVASFTENLRPGRTYQVVVKTVSGSVASWPATGNVTTRPLPVKELRQEVEEETGDIKLIWDPNPESQQDSFKVEYHELETFNGDSSSISVSQPEFSMENLQPGRNYSIEVLAVSKGIQSVPSTVFQATRPSSPFIEVVKPIPGGLDLSWRTDVTSKQEKYVVIYTRNDTAKTTRVQTTEKRISLQDLFPGAGYDIQVFAVSHGLQSEPHHSFQAVLPNPARNLTVAAVQDNRVSLRWQKPKSSLFTEFLIKYRTFGDSGPGLHTGEWSQPIAVSKEATTYTVSDLTPGEQFEIQVDSSSHHVASGEPIGITQIIAPRPVSPALLQPLLDAENVTLTWPRPEGRIDSYYVTWFSLADPDDVRIKDLPGDTGSGSESGLVRVLVESLHPGVEYQFEITTESHNTKSRTIQTAIRTQPLCTSELFIITNQEDSTSLTLRYTPTPLQRSTFDTYRFMLSDPDIPVKEKAAKDHEKKVTFVDLVPGRMYNISLWTVSGGVTSRPVERQDRLHPQPVHNINATQITDKQITLIWDSPQGDFDSFEVQYLDAQGRLIQNFTYTNTITIGSLRPYWNYTFTVVTKAGTDQSIPKRSTTISSSFSTLESVPGSLTSFEPIDVQPREITFKWNLPDLHANGVITGFTIQWGPKADLGKPFIPEERMHFESGETQGKITGLEPGQKYTFQIQAKTKVGYGPQVRKEQKMPILAPPTPASNVFPTEIYRSMHTVTVRFRKNYFSDINGPVLGYSVIVAEDNTKHTEGDSFLPGWRDVQKFSVWPPYQVIEPYYPFNNSSVEDFTVGTEDCTRVRGKCNGKLKPGTIYRFKVRAYTAGDKFSETAWSQRISTDPDNTAILVGITVPIIILVLVLLAFVVLRKLHCAPCAKSKGHHGGGRDHSADLVSLPDSVIETSRPVKLKDFAEHYRIMSADSDFRFSEEYEEFKHVGRDQLCAAADLPVNRPKNRFTNILPYDHSRVKLSGADDEDGSDFINANFVPGFNSKREFIVTQGPLHSTRDDYWRMCWETNSRAIVMLTRCIEKGREKCDHYWPYDTEPVYYGDIQVTILNESHFPDWNINEFRMMRGDTVRTIRHFHFTTWPDFGVPEPPQTLVRFVRAFRERVSPEQRPIVVHCSAGVGRSGTFIALDRILQGIRKYDVVDIFGIVFEMRKERVWMVQTEQQYICIHQCLLAVLEGKEHDQRHLDEMHDNEAFEDDEGIAESGM